MVLDRIELALFKAKTAVAIGFIGLIVGKVKPGRARQVPSAPVVVSQCSKSC